MNNNDNKYWLYLGLIMEVGLNMVILVTIGVLVGVYFDNKLALKGVCTIIGALLGIAGGFYNSYKAIRNIDKRLGLK